MSKLSAAYKAVANKVDSFDLTLKVLGNRHKKIENIMTNMNQNYETSVAMLAQISGNKKEGKDKQVENFVPQTMSGGFGSPREWVRKAKKYSQLHQVAEELKVGIAEIYLKGKADIWFHGFAASHPDAGWNLSAEELCRRFSNKTGEEIVETFSKIRQFGTGL
ncbi:Uncharacterized protein Adt_07270 [Abeliophyllum distichum]|uniref:Uncharacterized protein n=1 Tax=Abeliophyllum distichum TaxID=126358 RepID=A0ABD1V995_9LAMI